MTIKYYIKIAGNEKQVSKEKFIEYEKICGFYSKTGLEEETATSGFGYSRFPLTIDGRIDYDEIK